MQQLQIQHQHEPTLCAIMLLADCRSAQSEPCKLHAVMPPPTVCSSGCAQPQLQLMIFLAWQIKQALDFAYQQLTAPSDASDSLLERIIRVDTVLTDRPRPENPPVPEQLEQDIRDQMHHRSKRSRHEGSHKERKHKDKDIDGSRHKDKRRRRERSLEFTDPDLEAPPEQERDRSRSYRSSSREKEHLHKRARSNGSNSKDEGRSHKRSKEKGTDHASRKHHKSDHHRSSKNRSPVDTHQSKHIRFN